METYKTDTELNCATNGDKIIQNLISKFRDIPEISPRNIRFYAIDQSNRLYTTETLK
jgi:hypothetical protein